MPLTATLNLFHPECKVIANTLVRSRGDNQLRQNPHFREFIGSYVIYLAIL
jgi:hypothetical protein